MRRVPVSPPGPQVVLAVGFALVAAIQAPAQAVPTPADLDKITFRPPAESSLEVEGEATYPTLLADLDGDGDVDLVTSRADRRSIHLHEGDRRGRFSFSSTLDLGRKVSSVRADDVDGDGTADLLVSAHDGSRVLVLHGDGALGFTVEQELLLDLRPRVAAVADLDGDGDLDAVATHDSENAVTLLENDGTGRFTVANVLREQFTYSARVLDVDEDGVPDLVINGRHPFVGVRIGLGDFAYAESEDFIGERYTRALTTADLDGDGHADIGAWSTKREHEFLYRLGNGDGSFSPLQRVPFTGTLGVQQVADLDGDGALDLVAWANEGTGTVRFRLGVGDGTFGAEQSTLVDGVLTALVDLDGDGRLDAVQRRDGQLVVARGKVGGFRPADAYPLAEAITALPPVDLDGDGRLDLVARDDDAPRLFTLRNVT